MICALWEAELFSQGSQRRLFSWLALSFLTGCSSSNVLAGSIDLLNSQPGEYADGIGSQAEFGDIIAIGVDSKDTVFVADGQHEAIRTINPQGQVRTLIGARASEAEQAPGLKSFRLQGLNDLTVYRDMLYFISDGCIQRVQLNLPAAEQKVEPYFGFCNNGSTPDASAQVKALGNLSMLKADVHGNLYTFGKEPPYSSRSLFQISPNKAFKKHGPISNTSLSDFVVDSRGATYSSTHLSFKSELSKNGMKFDAFEAPRSLAVTKDDSLYVSDLGGLQLLLPDGTVQKLGYRVEGSHFILSQTQNILYSATDKTVYRTFVPKH